MHNPKITTGEYEVVASGVFHPVSQLTSIIEVDNFKFEFTFREEENKETEIRVLDQAAGPSLKVEFINFEDSLGKGNVEPVKIAESEDSHLYLSYRISALTDKTLRTFEYTFYRKSK